MEAIAVVYMLVTFVIVIAVLTGFFMIVRNTAETNKLLKALSIGQDQEIFALQSILEQLGGEWIWEDGSTEAG